VPALRSKGEEMKTAKQILDRILDIDGEIGNIKWKMQIFKKINTPQEMRRKYRKYYNEISILKLERKILKWAMDYYRQEKD
jgi:hypothetical protein